MSTYQSRKAALRKKAARRGVLAMMPLIVLGLIAGGLLIKWSFQEIKEFWYSLPYEEYVTEYCEQYDVDPLFIYAMMKQESNFNPKAVSIDNARGLLQLTEETYDWVKGKLAAEGVVNLGSTESFEDMFEPQTNIRYAVWLTAYLMERFDGEEKTVVAAYHAGMNITDKWLDNPVYSDDGVKLKKIPYSDTQYHVRKVMGYYEEYIEMYRSGKK